MPSVLWLVRHGESAANVAGLAAYVARHPQVDLPTRDADIPLSARGERQARALGRWLAERPARERPTVVLTSPYARAFDTARLIVEAGGAASGPAFGVDDLVLDERVREKELGLFHNLTRYGIEERHPEQWAFRQLVGPFYYRPPNGESWADVVQRLRGVFESMLVQYAGERVMVVCHQLVIYCARYVLEGMTEAQVVALAREHDVANCSVTTYERTPSGAPPPGLRGRFALTRFNFTVPIEEEGVTVTAEPATGVSAADEV